MTERVWWGRPAGRPLVNVDLVACDFEHHLLVLAVLPPFLLLLVVVVGLALPLFLLLIESGLDFICGHFIAAQTV